MTKAASPALAFSSASVACFSRRLKRKWYRERWQRRIEALWPETTRAIVLDPFGGSGTTGRVATRLRRASVLLDIGYKGKYAPLAKERTAQVQMELL